MRKCYFCDRTTGLKGIWLEEDFDGEIDAKHSCCFDCFNDPEHGMEDAPISGVEWFSTNYSWQKKKQA